MLISKVTAFQQIFSLQKSLTKRESVFVLVIKLYQTKKFYRKMFYRSVPYEDFVIVISAPKKKEFEFKHQK